MFQTSCGVNCQQSAVSCITKKRLRLHLGATDNRLVVQPSFGTLKGKASTSKVSQRDLTGISALLPVGNIPGYGGYGAYDMIPLLCVLPLFKVEFVQPTS